MHESRSPQGVLQLAVAIARRWYIALPFVLVTPLVAYVLTASQPSVYQSSADVLLSRQGFVISGLEESSYREQTRNLKTQVRIARLPDVEARVVATVGSEGSGLLARSVVAADGNTDLMTFFVYERDPDLAQRLATAYAEQYIAYTNALDTRSLRVARRALDRQIERAADLGIGDEEFAELVEKQQQLTTALAALETNATLAQRAFEAVRVAPRPLRLSAEAAILGLIVGIGLAWLTVLFDPRTRAPMEISEQLGVPLLGRIPLAHAATRAEVATLARADDLTGEAVDFLRATLDRGATGESSAAVFLVASSRRGEGSRAVVANLAVAFASTGRRVALIDADLGRPGAAAAFEVPAHPGFIDGVKGTAARESTLHAVQLERIDGIETARDERRGRLVVVPSGPSRTIEAGEIFRSDGFSELLLWLRNQFDLVLLDGPPLLEGGDALTLSAHADSVVLVASTARYRRSFARQIQRLLTFADAPVEGVVVVGTAEELALGHVDLGTRTRVRDLTVRPA